MGFVAEVETTPILTRLPESRQDEEDILRAAQDIIRSRWTRNGEVVSDGEKAFRVFQVFFGNRDTEMVAAIYLDNANRMIAIEPVSEGTIDGAAVYPRELAKQCLLHNAAGVIVAHNHPSGRATPSEADRHLTRRLGAALRALDVHLLDHLILGYPDEPGGSDSGLHGYYSFADQREASLA